MNNATGYILKEVIFNLIYVQYLWHAINCHTILTVKPQNFAFHVLELAFDNITYQPIVNLYHKQ